MLPDDVCALTGCGLRADHPWHVVNHQPNHSPLPRCHEFVPTDPTPAPTAALTGAQWDERYRDWSPEDRASRVDYDRGYADGFARHRGQADAEMARLKEALTYLYYHHADDECGSDDGSRWTAACQRANDQAYEALATRPPTPSPEQGA